MLFVLAKEIFQIIGGTFLFKKGLVVSSNIFGKRFGHQVTEYANRIFVIGGTEIDLQNTRATYFNVMNDIWGSANGKTWIKYEIDNSEWFIEDYSQKPNNFFSITSRASLIFGGLDSSECMSPAM